MTDSRIEALSAALPVLSIKDREFAGSLIAQYVRKGSLSDKQWPWIVKLAERAVAPRATTAEKVGNMAGIIALFNTAKGNGIKFPRIRFDVDGEVIVLTLAGDASRYAGSINVTSTGTFDSRDWYGRIAPEGDFTKGKPGPAGLVSHLAMLAANPAEAGAAHGRRTGKCGFCAKDLTDKRSIEGGYGPVCARRWDLPWGE